MPSECTIFFGALDGYSRSVYKGLFVPIKTVHSHRERRVIIFVEDSVEKKHNSVVIQNWPCMPHTPLQIVELSDNNKKGAALYNGWRMRRLKSIQKFI